MIVPDMFTRSVERTPDRDALVSVEGDRRYTYRALREEVYRVANSLADLGVEKGVRVAIGMTNSVEHVVLNLALQHLGAVAVPFNFRVAAGSVEHHVSNSGATVLAFDHALADAVDTVRENLDCDAFVYAGDDGPSYATPFAALREAPAEPPDVEMSPDDLSVILYTSGTTGQPKGVPLDHRAAVMRAIDTSLAQGSYVDADTTLSTMPLYHTIGLHSNCLSRLCLSGTFVPMPDFDPGAYLDTVERESVTVLFTAPTILNRLVTHDRVDEVDLSSVRVLGYGGEPISEHVVDLAREHFDPDRMINIYGTTETYHPLALTEPRHSGRNGAFYRRRIVELGSGDPTAEVDPGETGELIVDTNSPIVFDGYWDAPGETEASIHDGWFFTGDAAFETPEGHTAISGRADDTIISGGENIHPSAVEDVLISHPAVADVGVVGLPDDEWGERVTAFVVADGEVTAEELDAFCRDHDDLDDFKRPRAYEFVEEVPRNPSGKIMRYRLRESDEN